jgi:hypothetical protein
MSTIKVDTYLTRGGASEIAIDKLKGVTAAGSMLVVGEGGTNTTNLQQGLCKGFCVFAGSSFTTTLDSFNMSGGTDNGTGDYTVTILTDMASVNYATIHNKDDGTTNNWSMSNENNARTKATGSCHVMSTYGGTSTNNTKYDTVRMYVSLMGDLA